MSQGAAYRIAGENAFYPKNNYNDKSEFLGKRNNIMGMMKEDNEFMSPKPPSSGINFNPSLSNKFRKRMFDKPLQLNLGGINRGSNIVLASARFEENDNRNEVPNIHKTLKNAANFKNSKLNKILQDQSKGSSTSRNRNHNINQSFNAVPRLKENFLMGPGAGKINFSGFQRENMDLGGLANSLDMSARSSRNKFFSPPAEGRESMMTLQRKVGELKEVLADRESQVETLKRNIRSNQIDTLKNENNMLYAKCRRLQKIICIMMDKTKDTDLGFETELMIEIEEALRDPSLKVKIKTSMNKMTSLQEHNNKLTKELEEMRRMLNEKDRKSTFTKDDDLLDSNEESKDESNQKSKINRGETKIIKHKSGSGAKTKKVIAFNKNLKDIDGQKLNSRINAGKSEKQFLERGSDDSSAETITENQISESLAELRLLLQVFESKSIKFLFGDKYSVDIEAAKEIFSSKLNLGTNQANKLSRFLIESKPIEGLQNKSSNLSCQEIMNKIESVVGKYRKYSANDIQELIESFYSPQNDCYRSRFITEMDDLIHAEKVSKNEFEKTVTNLNLDINIKTLIIMLMRESTIFDVVSSP